MGVERDHVLVLSVLVVLSLLSACNKKSTPDATDSLDTDFGSSTAAAQPDPVNGVADTGQSVNSETNAEQPSLGAAVDGLSPAAQAQTQTPVVEFCEGSVLHTNSVVIPLLDKPDYMSPYTDPHLGARVTRITNSDFGEVNKPVYSTMQAWNADESYLLLYRTGATDAGHILLDGHSYEYIKHLDLSASGIEELFWSYTDPEVLYYVSKRSDDFGQLKEFKVNLEVSTTLADFTDICGSGLPNAGNDVQMHAVTDDLFGFRCQADDGHDIMFSYQRSTNSIVTAPIGMGSDWSAWSAPVPASSGSRFFHQGFVLDNDLQAIEHQLDMANPVEHSSIGATHNGEDAFYQVAFNPSPNGCDGDLYSGVGHLVEHNLETGACRNIISEEFGYPYTTSSTHVSAQAYLSPERIALSSVGSESQLSHFTNGIAAPALFSEIYLAKTTPGDTQVCRLAHHRSYGKSAKNGGYTPYFGEPHATISPSGTRIIFGSDWYDSGSVDSFVVELPDYLRRSRADR